MDDLPNTSSADASPPFDHDYDYDEYYSEFAAFLSDPSSSSDMRKTARGSLKQSLCAGGGTLTGSLIGGPVGGLVGGVAGSIIGYLKSDNYSGVLNDVLKLQGEARKVRTRKQGLSLREVFGRNTNFVFTSVAPPHWKQYIFYPSHCHK